MQNKTITSSQNKLFVLLSAFLFLINLFYICSVQASCEQQPSFTVVLDSGHNPKQPGALGVRGIYEVMYNDRLTAQIADALHNAGIKVILTRTPTQQITLNERAQIANTIHADLFLAIHHDSAQPKYLEKITHDQITSYRSTKLLSGYSIFVSKLNPQFQNSYMFAKLLGENMLQLGRAPATYHVENIPGENRKFLDEHLGIYQFDDLIVLKKNIVPAVLLEIGVIIDTNDEKYVSNKSNQHAIVQAIVAAIQKCACERKTVA